MNAVELLNHLRKQDVEIWVDGDQLHYRAPMDVLTPTLLDQMRQRKAKILRLLDNGADRYKVYPISYGQKSLWFLHQFSPESAAYNIGLSKHIPFNIDESIRRSISSKLIARHAILRTTYAVVDDEPVQRVHEYLEACFEQSDASSLREDELSRRVMEAYKRPFDLERGPILRVNVFLRSEQTHILLITLPHIAVDGWSVAILLNELGEIFRGEIDGDEVSLRPLNRRYTDFVDWQTKMLMSPEGKRHGAYWRKQLSGELSYLNLKTDRPRPRVQTYDGSSHSFGLTEHLTERLRLLARDGGATLYMTLLAVFQVLLHRYTGQDDIIVGSPASGRSQAEFAGVVGYFVNPIALRGDFSFDPTFKAFHSQVRRNVLDALAHQDYPLSLIVDGLRIDHDPSRSALFQVMFNYNKERQPKQLTEVAFDGPQIKLWDPNLMPAAVAKDEYFNTIDGEGQFDLTLEMSEANGSIQGVFKYNVDLFEGSTIARMEAHLQTLLKGIVANPELRVSELPLLSEAERHQCVVEWNDTKAEYPSDKCLHELIQEQAMKTPDATAAVYEDSSITYDELNIRTNQLSVYLNKNGVKAGTLVGILMERSIDMMVGLIGILKAGGAYVPLEPMYPDNRLIYQIEDTQLPVLITQSSIEDRVPACQAQIVRIDHDWDEIADAGGNAKIDAISPNVENLAGSDSTAYVVYTSGSTGKPKGVAVLHRGLTNVLWSMAKRPGFTGQDRLLALTTISFDIAALELFLPLIKGGQVEIVPTHVTRDAVRLKERIERAGPTIIQATPATWQLLRTVGWEGDRTIKILCGGETLPKELAEYLIVQGKEVWNLYGPTETTIWSSVSEVRLGEQISIGRPIANTQFYILDRYLNPVPPGVPGELYIGGDGLAEGYLNHPELTSEVFIPNPFDKSEASRLYKTGDSVRYLPHGNIEYLDRLDNQVKIRGFRIELGEIEAVLTGHPAVDEIAVIARDDLQGDRRLVAYTVLSKEHSPRPAEIRTYLKRKLPDYMVPSAFVILDEMPLTPNGKIDRNSLPAAGTSRLVQGYISPRTEGEKTIAEIWSDVLGIERIGILDNFFELGGDSLLATQVVTRLRAACAVELPVSCIFDSPTVAGVSELIARDRLEQANPQEPGKSRVTQRRTLEDPSIRRSTLQEVSVGERPDIPASQTIQRSRPQSAIPLSFAQERLWFLDQLVPENPFYNMPISFRIRGRLNIPVLGQALREIVQRHEALRTRFEPIDGQLFQIVDEEIGDLPTIEDLRHLPMTEKEYTVQQMVIETSMLPFDLKNDSMFRALLVVMDEADHVLAMTMHHIVSDGWSIDIFLKELSLLYVAFSKGHASPLEQLPLQYTDFAVWQRQSLSGPAFEKHLSYWQERLQGIPQVHNLPLDKPRPGIQTYRGAHHSSIIDKETTEGLKELCRSINATLFMGLQAAFSVFICRYSGERDVVIGTPIANRLQMEVEPLIGLFSNTLLLRTDLSDNPRFMDLIKATKANTISAYDHQSVPFELLVKELNPERSLSHNPLFQLMLAVDHNNTNATAFSGLNAIPVGMEYPVSKFDLSLNITESSGQLLSNWEYATDIFNGSSIKRMSGIFGVLLRSIIERPYTCIDELSLLTGEDHRELPADWSDTGDSSSEYEYVVL